MWPRHHVHMVPRGLYLWLRCRYHVVTIFISFIRNELLVVLRAITGLVPLPYSLLHCRRVDTTRKMERQRWRKSWEESREEERSRARGCFQARNRIHAQAPPCFQK